MMRAMWAENVDLRPCLSSVTIAALVVHGDYDHIPIRFPLQVAEALPDSTFVKLDQCGHFPWIEAEDAFYQALDSFFDEVERAKSGN